MRCRRMLPASLVVLMALQGPGLVSATPIPALDLPGLAGGADLVVVGQVTGVREEGRSTISTQGRSIPARKMAATLRADRVLKGRFSAAVVTFGFLAPQVPLGYQGIGPTQFGLFFLRASQQGYEVLDPYHPFIVAAPDAPAIEGSPLDRAIAEVAHVLNSPKAPPDERVRAAEILEGVETPAATEALRKAVRAPDDHISLHAAAALLRRKDISVLGLAEKALTAPPQNIDAGLRRKLAFALRDGVTDPEAVPALTRLLRAGDVVTRRSAAAALRHVGDDSVIRPLSLALHDGDREVRYQAVLGLAAVTGQSEWGPSLDMFVSGEQRYLDYWREWAKTR